MTNDDELPQEWETQTKTFDDGTSTEDTVEYRASLDDFDLDGAALPLSAPAKDPEPVRMPVRRPRESDDARAPGGLLSRLATWLRSLLRG